MSYHVQICGEFVPDDGLELDLGAVAPDRAWWEVPLPACPDCGGDIVWWEAGFTSGTRKCLGRPTGERDGRPFYDPEGGCGSFFRVETQSDRAILRRAILRRERFY